VMQNHLSKSISFQDNLSQQGCTMNSTNQIVRLRDNAYTENPATSIATLRCTTLVTKPTGETNFP